MYVRKECPEKYPNAKGPFAKGPFAFSGIKSHIHSRELCLEPAIVRSKASKLIVMCGVLLIAPFLGSLSIVP
eukprot:2590470-Amphidinium_carterae.1